MSRLRGTVWIAEQDAFDDPNGGTIWTARFEAHHDTGRGMGEELLDAGADEAIAWGRARAPLVWIRLADSDYFAAGTDHEPWATPWDASAPAPVRRRPPGEQWRDRPEDADRIAWSVQVDLSPPYVEPRPDWDAEVAHMAARGGASGWRARELGPAGAGTVDDGNSGDGAWFGGAEDVSDRAMLIPDADADADGADDGPFDATTYRLDFELTAATAVHAMEYGLDRCLVPHGWSAIAWARPLQPAQPA
ncbi:hypothetical protein [Conexibacter sp. CPCC 206217]|uniref:hypothetical protein n=1 Tax=Conexibacter sp. CPCC 206217 TaxID=3064574 RepID=UPI002725F435|nr:hypothetical protein [Conexibacter sp. CPCC 206217]MDO8209903.1 hypothetical protein [Conexibacter sp. CPCC 206217]